ncbi:23S rRNA pseudouridine(955/2504/2580) synthase RluC [Aurantivibrio plasticivorans]
MTNSKDQLRVSFVEVEPDSAGQRIDNFLLTHLKGVPKSRIYRLLRKGEVRVNKGRIKPEYKLCSGDSIRIPPIRTSETAPAPVPSERLRELLLGSVLFENDQMLIINKPSGIAVHGGSGINLGVVETLRYALGIKKLELVHRIDRDTSGCLLLAKRRSVLNQLQDQFRAKTVQKHYQTLVEGSWPKHVVEVNAPLLKNQLKSGERMVQVTQSGKPSVTRFKILQRFDEATLLQASPVTGRTHQIRVHCQFTGHPIVGDDKYGNADVNKKMREKGFARLFLHAASLTITDIDSGKPFTVEAPLPAELLKPLELL